MSDGYETTSDDERDEMPLAMRRTASDVKGQVKTGKNSALAVTEGEPNQRHTKAPTMLGNPASTPRPKTKERFDAYTIKVDAVLLAVASIQNPPQAPSTAATRVHPLTSPKAPPISNASRSSRTPPETPFPSVPCPPILSQSERMGLLSRTIKVEDGNKLTQLLVKEVEDRKISLHILDMREVVV
jgi:hypothetical protein